MVLAGQLRNVAIEVQDLLPEHLARWQTKVREWGAGYSPHNVAEADALTPVKPTLAYQYTVLAVINDWLRDDDGTADRIEPDWLLDATDSKAASAYVLLKLACRGENGMLALVRGPLRDADAPWLRRALDAVKADLLPAQTTPSRVKPRKSVAKGDAAEKIKGALREHHKYDGNSCLNQEPIGVNALGRKAHVSSGSVSAFFNREFSVAKDGYKKYQQCCQDIKRLLAFLKLLSGDYAAGSLIANADQIGGRGTDHNSEDAE
jgi:hypothetical protein